MRGEELFDSRLRAQVEAMSGDAHVRNEAAPWIAATPEERLRQTWALCRDAAHFASTWPDDVARRAAEPEPLPADTVALLARMRAGSR